MKVEQRDIILIHFPFSDLSGTKVRPALVISNNTYNSQNLDVIVLALTSNLSKSPFKVYIENKDLEKGNLPVKSAIRVDKPFSISQTKVLKIQGKVNYPKFEDVKTIFQAIV